MNKPLLPRPLTDEASFSKTATQALSVTKAGQTTAEEQEKLMLYRVVVLLLLGSLLWKSIAFPMLYRAYVSIPLEDSFFPKLFRSANFLACSYLLPILLGGCVLVSANRRLRWIQAVVTIGCMFVLCIHQGSYNDATCVTCFWTAAWCLWFVLRFEDPINELLPKAKKFGILIISMIFLGGAIGKWTPGYWSGEVLYQIYFVDRNYWIFNLLRANFDNETLREISTYYSRMVIMTESCCAFLWCLPSRVAAAIAITVFLGIVVFSNAYLFSVMFCLLGLAIVGLHASKVPQG